MDLNALVKTKTFWTGIAALLGSVGGVLSGEMDAGTAITVGVNALLGIFLRDAVAKK